MRARLWDGPTRLFHWVLAALILFAWWSAEADRMEWHRWSGYGVMALILFRLIWGFVGSGSARFSSFVRGPMATMLYARTLPDRNHVDTPGHNPLGAWSVLALLVAISVQVLTGLFTVDVDGIESGPLSDRVSFEIGREFAELHHLSFIAVQVLVAIHVSAITFYLIYKRSNLVVPMITGRRTFAVDPALRFVPLWRALAAAPLAGAITWWVMRGLKL